METEEPKELEDSCLSSSSRKQGVSTVLTLGLQTALPFWAGALTFLGLERWGKEEPGGQVQAQEQVGVEACLGPLHKLQKGPRFPHFLPFSLRPSFVSLLPCGVSLPCHFPKR